MLRKLAMGVLFSSITLNAYAQNCDVGCQMEQARIAQENSIIFWEQYHRDVDARIQKRNAQLGNDNANRTQNWWGAVSVNLQAGNWYWVTNHLSAADALENVRKGCTDDQCIPLAIFRNTCVAAASSKEGGLFWGDDVKPTQASKKALEKCQLHDAKDKSCAVPKDYVACSGYNYGNWQGKTSNFNRGGIIGVMSPKSMGIPDVKPPEVIYDPRMLDFTAQTFALKSGTTISSIGKNAPLWMAVALSSSSSNLAIEIGITEDIAKAKSKKECGVSDCQIILSFQGDSCSAMGSGMGATGQSLLFMKIGDTEQKARDNTMQECKNFGSSNCQVHVSQCHDLTP